ncbi:hypothetical protein [Granulicella sp. S156]|jgi:hypothetical protein|uniref:hypothetical protein n=1 Tax=Granulicella sp. S156 TaxID=1747224 RepID=UPI00131DA77F|nr:hypothetical protein [Granulicella sp. S156]
MKAGTMVALAIWSLEHLTFGCDHEALCGDLLEELQSGRSSIWFWREVLMAIGISAYQRIYQGARPYALPLVFSAGWSALYPAWRLLAASRFSAAIPDYRVAWPYSSFQEIARGVGPAVTFVWLGFLVFLLLRRETISQLSSFRLFQGLSASLDVLFLATLGLIAYLRHPAIELQSVTRDDFYTLHPVFGVSIPLAASIFVAIWFVLPRTQRPPRRRRLSRAWLARTA